MKHSPPKNSMHNTNEVARNTFSTSLRTNNKLADVDWRSLRGHVIISIFNFDFGLQELLLGQLQILPKIDRTTRSHNESLDSVGKQQSEQVEQSFLFDWM